MYDEKYTASENTVRTSLRLGFSHDDRAIYYNNMHTPNTLFFPNRMVARLCGNFTIFRILRPG